MGIAATVVLSCGLAMMAATAWCALASAPKEMVCIEAVGRTRRMAAAIRLLNLLQHWECCREMVRASMCRTITAVMERGATVSSPNTDSASLFSSLLVISTAIAASTCSGRGETGGGACGTNCVEGLMWSPHFERRKLDEYMLK